MPTLREIRDTVARYAQLIASVTGVDVEVVDADLIRLAGTGIHADAVGENIRAEGEVYRHVMRIRRTFVLENPREHFICTRCPGRDACRETLSVSTPIIDGDDVLGVIGLVCSTDEDRTRVLARRDVYARFIEQCAEFILHKLRDHASLLRAQSFLDIMLRILEINSRGIIIFNAKGGISYLNDVARRDLGLGAGLPTDIDVKRTGEAFSDMEEFVVTALGRAYTLMGQMSPLSPSDYHFATVFTFESLPSMVGRVSSLGDAASGSESLIGRSPAMLRLKEQLGRIAGSTSTVLVSGESGTGKELVARAVHAASDRRDKPFIGINCGAIPDALLESELFGYAGGAFTGANARGRIGKFELAHRGVLFLDEIGTMPLSLQVKLLRVLQERAFTRLGSNRLIEVDIRIIAATNEDLAEAVRQGRFREDLFYRLNVIPLRVPPLREREGDIELLDPHFLARYGARFGKPVPELGPGMLAALAAYPWPGNVREFENVMEFMVNMAPPGGVLRPDLLPASVRGAASPNRSAPPEAPGGIVPLHDLERRAILDAVRVCGGDTPGKKAAAAALGIGVATLYRKLKEYGEEQGLRRAGRCPAPAGGHRVACDAPGPPRIVVLRDVFPEASSVRETESGERGQGPPVLRFAPKCAMLLLLCALRARVAELVDALDLESSGFPWGFNSPLSHQTA